ncbi:hypothetical protein [Flavobacterium aciduliphilum]|uniref:Uncharacterized protein n=1 Tax=Flavobacterium aciduliphilum TaxID=1101402 RepID=A0A328YR94_9FLAO|nr:hypothetical protein [Flavobacterium aciduliphilum]RAR72606.1 hypothetical protein CLV55_105176 [Flavobacterium aciduliphilum]
MGLIKEPLNIDFVVENRPLTKEEEKQISEYIISQKKKRESKNNTNSRISKTKQKV